MKRKFDTISRPSLDRDFSYNTQGGVTIAHAIVKQYATETKYKLTTNELNFVHLLLEDNTQEGTCVTEVPTNQFKVLWQGKEKDIKKLHCGRFNINSPVSDAETFVNLQR